jgi:putative FmdB family regulatory protein
MPTYDYVCKKCGHSFEYFQSMNDDKLTDCPLEECEGNVKRLLGTGAGIIFKGGGFYQTDYRSDSYKSGAKKESEASKSSESKSDSSSSSKESKKKDSGKSGGSSASSSKAD